MATKLVSVKCSMDAATSPRQYEAAEKQPVATRNRGDDCRKPSSSLPSVLRLLMWTVPSSIQVCEQAAHRAGVGRVDDVSAAPLLRKQASAYQLLEMEGERSRSDPETLGDDAGRQPLGATTREQAHQFQPNILCQCAQRRHGSFTLHDQSASAGSWNPYWPPSDTSCARDWAIRNGD
jgi:hypothetical protein